MIQLAKDILSILSEEQRKKFYSLQLLVVFSAIAEVVSVAVVGPFMALASNISIIETNKLINNVYVISNAETPTQFIIIIGILVFIFLCISTILSVITIRSLSFFAARTGAEIGDTLYSSYLNKDYLFYTKINSSELVKQIATEVSRVTDNILQPFVQINARLLAVSFISILIFLYDPIISLSGLLVFVFVYCILFIFVRKKLLINGVNISKVSKKRFVLMNEGFGAIKDVIILNRQEDFVKQFKESGVVFSESYGSSNTLYNVPRYIMEFIMYSGMVVLIISLLYFSNGDMTKTISTLAVFGVAAFKLLPSFQQIYSSLAQIRSNLSALSEIKRDVIEARKQNRHIDSKNSCVEYGNNDLFLENISFKYPGKKTNTINEININIPRQGIVGLVGSSGAGKSTLLDILLGLLKPSSGSFICGNNEVDFDNIKQWQKRIGYVPQSIFLKDGNIIENIAFGLPENQIDMEKINRAIELAQLNDWIQGLPNGMLTEIGEKGVQISGGQKQRIGIARALYSDIDYLFFDEATSALDGKTEALIMNAIEKLSESKTIVMIAHRLNTVKNCDIIYMLDHGNVVDSGNFDYLIENNSKFREMAGED
ncbi:ABC transporter ATP-binding protein [Acinetobacter bereziniae]|uniref:ABC transporter ATP-binding protein n=1 Tax=Acinetobacter bereziniae TaxID=106648 RepID=UPI00125081E6|nr:ABC transporter ATP-binding protein [Acinetobacter bereziniae]